MRSSESTGTTAPRSCTLSRMRRRRLFTSGYFAGQFIVEEFVRRTVDYSYERRSTGMWWRGWNISRSTATSWHCAIPRRRRFCEHALAISEPVVAGDTVRFTITNRSPQRLYVTVFRLGTDFSIRRIEPTRGTTVTLAPGTAGSLRVYDQPLWNNHSEATTPVIYKIFVLATRVDLDSLQLPPLGEDRQPDRPSTRADSPLALSAGQHLQYRNTSISSCQFNDRGIVVYDRP